MIFCVGVFICSYSSAHTDTYTQNQFKSFPSVDHWLLWPECTQIRTHQRKTKQIKCVCCKSHALGGHPPRQLLGFTSNYFPVRSVSLNKCVHIGRSCEIWRTLYWAGEDYSLLPGALWNSLSLLWRLWWLACPLSTWENLDQENRPWICLWKFIFIILIVGRSISMVDRTTSKGKEPWNVSNEH